jgi:hypothetical protein
LGAFSRSAIFLLVTSLTPPHLSLTLLEETMTSQELLSAALISSGKHMVALEQRTSRAEVEYSEVIDSSTASLLTSGLNFD